MKNIFQFHTPRAAAVMCPDPKLGNVLKPWLQSGKAYEEWPTDSIRDFQAVLSTIMPAPLPPSLRASLRPTGVMHTREYFDPTGLFFRVLMISFSR